MNVGSSLGQPVEQYRSAVPIDLYMYKKNVDLTLSVGTSINDTTVTVVDATGANVGDVATFYELNHIYQTIIRGISGTTITLGSPIDYAFSTDAVIEVGIWNMAVDGSSSPVTFICKSPLICCANMHTLNVSMLDSTDMDDGTFGGIAALTNGVIFRIDDGITKNLTLIYNNLGFAEIGFDVVYSDRAPAGKFGFRATRDLFKISGTTLKLNPDDAAEFQIVIQDNLTGLDQLACTLNGFIGD